ncbi:MAG: hypothetical protein DMF70_10105 [Acidobacteria bacterium]|nr:MAG: hypothetical protein DMF70_10105 [Acidobacteriota bacterium]
MKRIILKSKVAIALGVIAIFVTATAFARAGKQDFLLHNQTGVEIHSLYVSPHSANDWEEDINSLEWYDLNLIEIDEVTLHWDAKAGKGWADIK